ncbi:MAG TPA: hypothetical protein EYP28_07505 [Methanophagales archaeon]|nr:hypothetical protein [Methanophagales archaeon]
MTTKVGILYLYASLAEEGFGHIKCRKLIESLNNQYTLILRYAIVPDDVFLRAEGSVKQQTISETDFLYGGYEVLIIEWRLRVRSPDESEKVRAATLKRFLDNGGIVIFMFREENEFIRNSETYNAFLEKTSIPLIRQPRSEEEFPDIHLVGDITHHRIIHGFDKEHALHGNFLFSIDINKKYLEHVNFQIHPAFEGVSKLIVNVPVQVDPPFDRILLAGNPSTTRMLTSGDLWWDGALYHVLGAYDDYEKGVSAILTGGICDDFIVQQYETDGIQFMLNLVNLFIKYQRRRRPFLSLPIIVRQVQEEATRELSQAIEEKDEIYDRIVEQIHKAVQSHPSALQRKAEAIEFLQLALKDCWQELEESTRDFLTTGESVFRAFRTVKEVDFAAPAVEFAKALEVELNTKLINRFRSYSKKRGDFFQIIQRKDGSRSKLLSRKELTLGQIRYELKEVTSNPATVYVKFREYLKQESDTPDFWLDGDKFPKTLQTITQRYRNGAAHTAKMTLELFEEWRNLLLGVKDGSSLLLRVVKFVPKAEQ